ncbi:DNA gyrase subunit A [Silvanigrella paludirubra]|uniref:DNA gyrase subunit A n=1 Tax=Silvanigrella paludirubra TaxID=2499159 RepID=A0A6N6VXP6_9BACT|nr:DNA gyrase subunit A [Silvanigrella paludirubra]KAB8038825.1 DNA gyrase subunit A [Silvanigrella paludirubra]
MSLEKMSVLSANINDEMKNAYLDYAMSVIVSRALPDVRDGMKPVHRRVLYAMYEQNNVHNKPFKKSARIVGDVLGKYHPHGDSAVYGALVRLTQDFSMRYPLIDGQGNFGSIDGDSAAAMRYTEIRLAKISEALMADIEEDTVDFGPNYDNSETQPLVLPTVLPQLLINGQSGIAVGMATNIPPHNLGEVIDALLHMLEKGKTTVDQIMHFIKGPDFPTYGMICGLKGIQDAYRTGRGSIVVRGRAAVESTKGGREQIIVTELPYQVNKLTWIEKIAELVKDEEVQGISDIRDESNKEGIRVVIEIKKGENAEVILNHLYKRTRLQDSFGVNMVCIVRGVPRLLNIKETLEYFLEHRLEVITRRTTFRLRKAEDRLHILEGLKIAVDNIDKVVAIIRGADSRDDAKEKLISAYSLSEKQVGAILDMRLVQLTGLERDKIIAEHKETLAIIADLQDILNKPERVRAIVKEEFINLKNLHNDKRRTEIVADAGDVDIASLIPPADVFVTFSSSGYIKRVNQDEFRTQNRAGKGKTGAALKENDVVKFTFHAHTHDYVLMFSNLGKVYSFKVYELPEASATARGKSINQILTMSSNEQITAMLPVKEFVENQHILMVTKQGTIKKTELSSFSNIRAGGLRAVTLEDGDTLVSVKITSGKNEIIIATANGQAVRFDEDDVRSMGRTAKGVKGITIDDEEKDYVVAAEVVHPEESLLVVTENGYGKRSKLEEYRKTSRGAKGVKTIKISERNGKVITMISVSEDSDIMFTTNTGRVLRISVSSLRVMGRVTQGVCLMRILEDEKIVSVSTPSEFDDTPVTQIESVEEVE